MIFTTTSCNQKSNITNNNEFQTDTKYLELIDFHQELKLVHIDDRLGEWGGNTFIFRIYKDKNSEQIFADYKEFEGTTNPPPPPNPNESSESTKMWYEYGSKLYNYDSILVEKNKIKLTLNDKELIENAVIELINHKLKNESIINHSGLHNIVVSKDSSLIIDDYPSINWTNFQKLKKSLIKE